MKPDLVVIACQPSAEWTTLMGKWFSKISDLIGEVRVISRAGAPMEKRAEGFFASTSDHVIFLDEDTVLDRETVGAISQAFAITREPTLWKGEYSNPTGLPASGRAYNRLCNRWVSAEGPGFHRFLGGAFALSMAPRDSRLWSGIASVGGEEEIFATRWVERGFAVKSAPGFAVQHQSRKDPWSFFSRAVRQGMMKTPSSPVTPIRTTSRLVIDEVPWLLLHGGGVGLGVLFQRLKGRVKNPATTPNA